MADTYLDIVDENDEIIGQALRSEIHEKGWLHREIHVWFITQDKQIIFQKRMPDKDIDPDLLDATIGGHVELSMSYPEAAFMEAQEESGIDIDEKDLVFIDKYRSNITDKVTGKTNNVFRGIFGYAFKGNASDLKIESGAGAGFKSFPLEVIYNPTPEFRDEAIAHHIQSNKHYIFQALEKMVS